MFVPKLNRRCHAEQKGIVLRASAEQPLIEKEADISLTLVKTGRRAHLVKEGNTEEKFVS